MLSSIPTESVCDQESIFWQTLLGSQLKPVTVELQKSSKEIGHKLKTLRNSALTIILLINIMWIILFYTVTLPQLENYKLPKKAFQLLFLAVYGLIILASFVAMVFHRLLMLIQFSR